jgi:putative two-component system response regulator
VNTPLYNYIEQAVVMVVDDAIISVKLLEQALQAVDGVIVESYTNPLEALQAFRTGRCDLLITDIDMPEMSGLELIRACRSEERGRDIPIMVVTASTERELRQQALELGALDFLSKPLDAAEVRARTRNMVALSVARRKLSDRSAWLASEVRRATSTIAMRERETIIRLARAAEYRDWETGQHILRIAEYTRLIASELRLEPDLIDELTLSSPLHDIGKIGIPDYVLRKPDRLDVDEFALMQRHTAIGHGILSESRSRLLQLGAEIALTHHEKVDGSGYPHGLVGDAIPLSGRIVAIADVFDALTSQRPYKPAWPLADARSLLQQGNGKHFDADLLEAFFATWDNVVDARQRLAEDPLPTELADIAEPVLV